MQAVIISCFNWYEGRMKPIRELMLRKGYDVTVLIADFEHGTKEKVNPQHKECTYIHVPIYKKNISIRRLWSHIVFGKRVNEWINHNHPDLIFCQIPPNNVAKYCAKFKKKNKKTKLVFDLIDMWPESMPLGRLNRTIPALIWKKWRNDSLRMADHVFVECSLYQRKLKGVLDPCKTDVLYLFKEQTEDEKALVQEIIKHKENVGNKIKFAYLGSMNNILDIDGICDVIRRANAKGKKCELHAIGTGESMKRFKKAVEEVGCEAFFYGAIYDEKKKIRILAACDYAFNMMKDGISVGLTIKSVDYFSYGLPLINSIMGDTYQIVKSENVGINIIEMGEDIVDVPSENVLNVYEKYFTKEAFMRKVDSFTML